MKVFELAKELDLKSLELIEKLKPLDLQIKNHMASLSPEQITKIKEFLSPPAAALEVKKVVTRKPKAVPAPAAEATTPKQVVVRTRKTAKDEETESAPEVVEAAHVAPVAETPPLRRRTGIIVRREVIGGEETEAPEEMMAVESEIAAAIDNPSVSEATKTAASGDESDATLVGRAGAEQDPLLEKDSAVKDIEFTEEMFTQSRGQLEEDDLSEQAEEEAVPVAAAEEATPTSPTGTPATPPRRLSRYSVVRVVANSPAQRDKPLIVKDVDPNYNKGRDGVGGTRSFSENDFNKQGGVGGPSPALLKEIEKEEEKAKKKIGSPSAKARTDAAGMFKSTDFLRRERVYQPKKKKLLIGRMATIRPGSAAMSQRKKFVEFNKEISVENLADQMSMKAKELARKLVKIGLEFPEEVEGLHDWYLDLESTLIVAEELGYGVRDLTPNENAMIAGHLNEEDADKEPRSPVITIMGHVDHGKTSLLDLLRRARVASGEAGGITQHIGAYTINVADAVENLARAAEATSEDPAAKKAAKKAKKEASKSGVSEDKKKVFENPNGLGRLCFLDTPGHAAFSAIRSRGAQCTDIVILVIAASEGVMPQTREAIDHAKSAKVPIIVAMNKMDLPDANPDKIRQQLSDLGLLDEAWGGDTIFVPVSAKTGMGVDKLLEMIQIQAEVLELKARYKGPADGIIIEAKLDKSRGPLATVLIRNGVLKIGEYISAGEVYGKVRALLDDKGNQVKEAGPSTPVEIMGLSGVPAAGDVLNSVPDEKSARELAELRTADRKKMEATPKFSSVEDVYAMMAKGDLKELPLVLKSDVRGSSEAIQGSLEKLPQNKVRLKILSTGVGGISENDVLLASASKAIVIGFNVRPDNNAVSAAERLGIPIKTYSIIYQLIDEVSNAMKGLLEPIIKENVIGKAEVREVYNISKIGAVAGSMVTSGKLQRSGMARIVRDNRIVYTGKFTGLKRFKDDAKEVAQGFECGISVENYNDIKSGDIIECYLEEKIFPALDGSYPQANA
ncbi:MAG: translation initiation factor IF-2 [Bdellovibrionota bacterium]